MKKLFLLLSVLSLPAICHATWNEMWNDVPISSYTDSATPGPILFSSQTIRFTGMTISSAIPNSYVAFYRSTTPVFTADIATQTLIYTGWNPASSNATFIPLFEMTNASYTFISKVGLAQVTFWFHCTDKRGNAPGFCPGLKASGQR